MPVLLRYTCPTSSARWHLDGLAGATLLHAASSFTSIYSEYKNASTRANITLGPAIRYAFLPNAALTANGLVSAVVGDSYSSFSSFSDRLFLNVSVGAQYAFGQR